MRIQIQQQQQQLLDIGTSEEEANNRQLGSLTDAELAYLGTSFCQGQQIQRRQQKHQQQLLEINTSKQMTLVGKFSGDHIAGLLMDAEQANLDLIAHLRQQIRRRHLLLE